MTEEVESDTTKKKEKAKGKRISAGKAKTKAPRKSHVSPSEMVLTAVEDLNERGGSSLQAIKKYISVNYNEDVSNAKLAFFIRKSITSAVKSGKLVQTKGLGAKGSFKLPSNEGSNNPMESEEKTKATKKLAAKKSVGVKKTSLSGEATVKKAVAAKSKKGKKPPTLPKAPKPKETKATAVKKSPAKPKKKSALKRATTTGGTKKKTAS